MSGRTGTSRRVKTRGQRTSGDDSAFENDSRSSSGSGVPCDEDIMIGVASTQDKDVVSQTGISSNKGRDNLNSSTLQNSYDHMQVDTPLIMEEVKEKNAKIQDLELNFQVILDENNLLHLELADVEKTSAAKIATLEEKLHSKELSWDKIKMLVMGLRNQLNRLLDDNNINLQSTPAQLDELCALFGLSPAIKPTQTIMEMETTDKKSSVILETSLKVNESSTTSKVNNSSAAASPAIGLGLRRSKRQSVIDKFEKQKEASEVAASFSTVISEESTNEVMPLLKASTPTAEILKSLELTKKTPATPSPPKLEPVSENIEEPVVHAMEAFTNGEYRCACGLQYQTKQKLSLHVRQFTCEWKFQCKLCGIKYFEAYRLKSHMLKAHNEEIPGSHGCYYCGVIFEERRDLFSHQNEAQ